VERNSVSVVHLTDFLYPLGYTDGDRRFYVFQVGDIVTNKRDRKVYGLIVSTKPYEHFDPSINHYGVIWFDDRYIVEDEPYEYYDESEIERPNV